MDGDIIIYTFNVIIYTWMLNELVIFPLINPNTLWLDILSIAFFVFDGKVCSQACISKLQSKLWNPFH